MRRARQPRQAARRRPPRPPIAPRTLMGTLTLLLCGGALATVLDLHGAAQGQAWYDGSAPLVGRLQGHDDLLPPQALRCVNCHTGDRSLGPALGARQLLEPQARRGGPPTAYDATSFCRALRDGVDPAQIVLPREMPRYTLDDRTCQALWSYVSRS